MRNYIITALISLLAGAAITYYYQPTKVEIKEVEKEVIKNDIKTVIKEVKGADGKVETITEIIDNTIKTAETTKEVAKQLSYHVSVGYGINELKYSLQLEKYILQKFTVGARIESNLINNHSVHAVVGLSF